MEFSGHLSLYGILTSPRINYAEGGSNTRLLLNHEQGYESVTKHTATQR